MKYKKNTTIIIIVVIVSATIGCLFNPTPLIAFTICLMALLCEYVDSSLGMGYGTTLTPLLLFMGFPPLQIIPAVLCSEFVTGIFAGILHHRYGNIDFKTNKKIRYTTFLLSICGIVGVVIATILAVSISQLLLTIIIAIIILAMSIVILSTINYQINYRPRNIIILGVISAFNKGMSGGGYGPLVTSGQMVSGISPKHAIAITSVAEGIVCFVGLSMYYFLIGSICWTLCLPLMIGAIASVPIAAFTVKKLSTKTLKYGVGFSTSLLGLLMLVKLFFV